MLRLAWVGAIAGTLLTLILGVAHAQSISGGCRASVSGRTLPTMTFDDPLVITKGKKVRAVASVPATDRRATTNLTVKVGPVSNSYSFKGTRYNRTMAPPAWLFTVADGIVRFSGTASGNGFDCEGSGYIKIDGDGLLSVIGGALLGAGGAAGMASSSGPKGPPTPNELPAKARNDLGHQIVDMIKEIGPEAAKDYGISLGMLIALVLIAILVFGVSFA